MEGLKSNTNTNTRIQTRPLSHSKIKKECSIRTGILREYELQIARLSGLTWPTNGVGFPSLGWIILIKSY